MLCLSQTNHKINEEKVMERSEAQAGMSLMPAGAAATFSFELVLHIYIYLCLSLSLSLQIDQANCLAQTVFIFVKRSNSCESMTMR